MPGWMCRVWQGRESFIAALAIAAACAAAGTPAAQAQSGASTSASGAPTASAGPVSRDAATPIRIGLIGLDTSHAGAFTQLLNDPSRPDHIPGARVVAAFKGGSPDVEASASRVDKFTADLRDTWKIDIVESIDALIARVDAVILTSVDGRVHLAQARPVLAARKPLFIDKPLAASVRDAAEIIRLARAGNTPIFSASSLRYTDDVVAVRRDPRVAEVRGAITWGPATLEPHHPDLFWYGIHAVEMLYTFMGPGCERVTRTRADGADVVVGYWKDGRIGVMRGNRDSASTYGQVVFGPKDIVSTPAAAAAPASAASAGAASNGGAVNGAAASAAKASPYRGLLAEVITFFQTGRSPVPIDETLEIMAFMEAADASKVKQGAPVALSEVMPPR